MDNKIRILMLEDKIADVKLIEDELHKGNIAFISKRADTKTTFLDELKDFKPDLILADYKLPSFDGLSALAISQENFPDIPFIFVSEIIGEELAIETLKKGATDYVLKQNLLCLIPAIRHALKEKGTRVKNREAEAKIRKWYDFHKIIGKINQTFLKIKNEPELFQTVCNLLVDLKDIKFAWIGLIEKGSFEIKPVSHAGLEKGYLDLVQGSFNDSESDIDPMGRLIKFNQSVTINDIGTSTVLPFRQKKEALKRGYVSYIALPLIYEEETIGTLNLYSQEKTFFGDQEVIFWEEVANDIALGIISLRLRKKVEENNKQTQGVLKETIDAISLIAELRDPHTAGHQRRVSQLACAISRKIGIAEEQIEGIRIAGLLHDIGKISIPSEILTKPEGLTDPEFDIIKNHSNTGYKILKGIQFYWPVAKIVLQHHERINGSGYPSGISGNDIMIEARILGVADTVEAMVSHRPYRPALGIGKALEEIYAKSGTLYDPAVVDACLKVFREGFVFNKISL